MNWLYHIIIQILGLCVTDPVLIHMLWHTIYSVSTVHIITFSFLILLCFNCSSIQLLQFALDVSKLGEQKDKLAALNDKYMYGFNIN